MSPQTEAEQFNRVYEGTVSGPASMRDTRICHSAPDTIVVHIIWPAGDRVGPALGPSQLTYASMQPGFHRLTELLGSSGPSWGPESAASGFGLVRELLGLMSPLGRPNETAGQFSTDQWQVDQTLADVIAGLTTDLRGHPSLVDIAEHMDCSVRVASARVVDWFRRYHLTVDGWRSYVSRLRIELGRTLVQHPDVRTAELADWLGFRSSEAMFHAFDRVGMGAPVHRYRNASRFTLSDAHAGMSHAARRENRGSQ